jgi:hypothetical protein
MKEEFQPAIAALQSDVREIEKKAAETKRAINRLCELAGAAPIYVVTDTDSSRPSVTSLRNDQFYGKVMSTAAREYLEMRKAANLGPASPREIYEALVKGGFKFDTKSEINAITGLRQILRKNSSVFHRLPHGAYGLLAWYPNAKAAKADDDDDSEGSETIVRKTKVAKPKRAKASPAPSAATKPEESIQLGPFIMEIMKDGSEWDVARIKQELGAKDLNIPPDAIGRKVQGTLLSLASQKMIINAGNRRWRKAGEIKTAASHETAAVSKTAH